MTRSFSFSLPPSLLSLCPPFFLYPPPRFKSNFNKICHPLFILHEASPLKNIQEGEICYSKILQTVQGQNSKTEQKGEAPARVTL